MWVANRLWNSGLTFLKRVRGTLAGCVGGNRQPRSPIWWRRPCNGGPNKSAANACPAQRSHQGHRTMLRTCAWSWGATPTPGAFDSSVHRPASHTYGAADMQGACPCRASAAGWALLRFRMCAHGLWHCLGAAWGRGSDETTCSGPYEEDDDDDDDEY